MKFASAFLGTCVSLLLFIVGCGGDDPGSAGPPISTSTVVPSATTNGGAASAAPKKTNAAPTEYKTLIKRRGAKPHMVGTNQIFRLYHFTSGSNRFTGLARNISTNGLYTIFRIEHGLLDGYVVTKFPKTTNRVHQTTYLRGLKNGREYAWHKNGKLKLQGDWTNGVRTGTWFLWHGDGTTNRVDMYKDGKYVGKHKVFVSAGLARVWKAADLKSAYPGVAQAAVIKGFGSPDKIQGANWIYQGVKVPDAIAGKQTVTVVFTMQKGKVAVVNFQP